jgi:hypothetical protein
MTDQERQLLEMLAAEGKPTRLLGDQVPIAKSLQTEELVFLVSENPDACAVITPKGRHLLAGTDHKPKPGKPPFGFLG